MSVRIAPSLLSCDFARLGEEIRAVEEAGADWIHVDVMDGHFVPNLTIGPPVVQAIGRVATRPLDVHLMITDPDRWIEAYAEAGAAILTVHQEACPHLHRTLGRIRERGLLAGVSINPGTPLATLDALWGDFDLVLIMTVNPGFGGQRFLEKGLVKVAEARRHAEDSGLPVHIEVDGGVSPDTAPRLVEAGADVLVCGSALFSSPDYAKTMNALRAKGPR